MESQPQNPEFKNNPENFHLCVHIFFAPNLMNLAPILKVFIQMSICRINANRFDVCL